MRRGLHSKLRPWRRLDSVLCVAAPFLVLLMALVIPGTLPASAHLPHGSSPSSYDDESPDSESATAGSSDWTLRDEADAPQPRPPTARTAGQVYDFSRSFVAPTSAADDLLSAACRTNSFGPGTEVLMADGTTKPIEDVEIGDWVWATNPETGEIGSRQVIDTIVGDGEKHLADIRVAGGTLTATGGHPFWVDDEGRWIDAKDLTVGVRLELVDGSTVPLEAVATRVAVQRVHNLTVEGIHTYYVEVADEHVLTHNSGCLSPNQMNQAIRRGQAPRGITRIDTPKVPNEQLHATFEGGAALNVDGSWKHGFVDLTRAQRDWLIENGWDL